MSRSIHDTWARFLKTSRHRYEDPEVQREELSRILRNITRKQRIKALVLGDRSAGERPEAPPSPETIPIVVRDTGPGAFHPATPEDIRAVLRRLPPDACSGVGEIVLCAGQERTTGRGSSEMLPGLHAPAILGSWREGATIQLHAYTRTQELQHARVVELYLRMSMLSTLVHELAHHQDRMTRVARGRWRMDDRGKGEAYAEKQEGRWKREHVLPFLEEAHADEVEELQRWLEHHSGMRVPIATLFGDEFDAFRSFLRAVSEGARPPESCVELARTLLWCEQHETSLALVERVLSEHPRHVDALMLRARNLAELERHDAAFESAKAVIALDPGKLAAWLILLDHHVRRQDWTVLLRETEAAEAVKAGLAELPREFRWLDDRLRGTRILALVNLHRIDEALEGIRSAPADLQSRWDFEALHAMALLAGDLDERALEVCVAALARKRKRTKESSPAGRRLERMWPRFFEACRFVALARLGRAEAHTHQLEPGDGWPDPWHLRRFPELFHVWLPACRAKLTP